MESNNVFRDVAVAMFNKHNRIYGNILIDKSHFQDKVWLEKGIVKWTMRY